MTAIAYLRVSTDKQADSGAGLDAQEDACRRAMDVAAVYSDEGVSGSTGLESRPALIDAIAKLAKGDVLVVAKRDRLGRDPIAVAMIERLVAKRGARIMSAAGEGTEDDSPTSILMRRMVDAFAEYERLLIGARTKGAMQAMAARGARFGGPSYGETRIDGQIVEDADEQAVIHEARELRAAGLSLRAVAGELAKRGFVSRRGATFAATQVARMVA